jgi:UDP-N-acetylmuramoyl-tripeptide--D-alanyl-D-alanine ligase
MLCEIAHPDICLVLNVGLAHVGIFGDPDAVAVAKSEIVEALATTGVAILNADDQRTRAMISSTNARVVLFGEAPDAEVRADKVEIDELARARFVLTSDGQSADVKLQVFGEHQVSNALAAAAAARAVGIPLAEIAAGLSSAKTASPMRMDVSTTIDGVVLIDDAYNANPSSMRAALKALIAMRGGGRTFAVLGEMRELGELSVREHDAIGRLAVRLNVSQVVAVGQGARVLHLGAANEGSWDQESVWVPDAAAAIEYLRGAVQPGDVVLVKASRSIGLEVVCDALRQPGFTRPNDDSRDTTDERGAPA